MKIEAVKYYRTRAGYKARIYALDGGGSFPIQGAIQFPDYGWGGSTWSTNGTFLGNGAEAPEDLISEWVDQPRLLGYRHIISGQVILSAQPEDLMQHENYERMPHLDQPEK